MFFIDAHCLGDEFFNNAYGEQAPGNVDLHVSDYYRVSTNYKHLARFCDFVGDVVLPKILDDNPKISIDPKNVVLYYLNDTGANWDVHRDPKFGASFGIKEIFITVGVTDTGLSSGTLFPLIQHAWPSGRTSNSTEYCGVLDYDRDFEQPYDRWGSVFLPTIEYHCAPAPSDDINRGLFKAKILASGTDEALLSLHVQPAPNVQLPVSLAC